MKLPAPERVFSATALLISAISLSISIYFSMTTLRTSVLPALVFVYDSRDGWFLRNVGNGPALDPIVVHTLHGSDRWVEPTRIYPIDADGRVHLPWMQHNPDKIMVYYKDVHGRPYTSFADDDRTTIDFDEPDQVWNEDEERRVWER